MSLTSGRFTINRNVNKHGVGMSFLPLNQLVTLALTHSKLIKIKRLFNPLKFVKDYSFTAWVPVQLFHDIQILLH